MIAALSASVGFGVAAFLGQLLGRYVCAGQVAFEDGPAAVKIWPWTVVIGGSCVGAALAAHGASAVQLVTASALVAALAACTMSDSQVGVVPDLFTLLPLGALVSFAALHGSYAPLFSALLVGLPFSGAAVLTKGYGMGWGDVKLAALAGAVLGAGNALIALTLACIAAFVISRIGDVRGRPIAFAPYLAGGIGAVLILGATL